MFIQQSAGGARTDKYGLPQRRPGSQAGRHSGILSPDGGPAFGHSPAEWRGRTGVYLDCFFLVSWLILRCSARIFRSAFLCR